MMFGWVVLWCIGLKILEDVVYQVLVINVWYVLWFVWQQRFDYVLFEVGQIILVYVDVELVFGLRWKRVLNVRGEMMKVIGLNYIMLVVGDVERVLVFYCDLFGLNVCVVWLKGVYFEVGLFWLCLFYGSEMRILLYLDYIYFVFSVFEEDYCDFSKCLVVECVVWKGDNSEGVFIYFFDLDGYKLEIYIGLFEMRLVYYCQYLFKGVMVFD